VSHRISPYPPYPPDPTTLGPQAGHDLTGPGLLDRRQILRMFGALAAVGATGGVSACTEAPSGTAMEQPSGRTIKVGLVAPALGDYRAIGGDITNGFKLYLSDHGNLLGRHRVELRIEDEGPTPTSAVAAVEALLQSGVIALAGVASPASLAAVRDAVETAKVPLVSSNASPSTLTSAFYIWRASYVEGEAGRSLAPYARLEGTRAYLLYDDSESAKAETNGFRSAFADQDGTIVGDDGGTDGYAGRLQNARSADPDVIFASFGGVEAQEFLTEYRRSGMTAKVLGPGSLTETFDLTKLTERGAQLPQQVYTSVPYAYDLDNEANRRFASSYHKAHGKAPSVYAMTAYDAASVLDKALRLVEEDIPTAGALNQAFSLLGQIESPRGAWTFNINRTPQQKWYLRRLGLDGQVPGNLLDTDLMILS
jgi:branched-chain amino acid transport system substrate-binding protein